MTEEISADLLAPRENPELSGHEEAEQTLANAYQSGRLAHAWMISGPKGIGKATLAYRFARYVLANGGVNDAPGDPGSGPGLFGEEAPAKAGLYMAPDNPIFRRVAAGGHADFMSVECSLNDKGKLRGEIVVSDVRDCGRFFSMTAGEGGWRVAVIDAADEMNPSAANALLKVLEEPPANALLLLVTHNPGRMLPTIRSRCSKLALKPLDEDRLSALIARSHPDLAPTDAALLAHLADGSPGRALDLAEEGGLELYRDMTGLLETLPRLDIGALHSFGGRFIKAGQEESFQTVSGLLRWWLARLIVSVSGGTGASHRLNPQEEVLATRLGQSAGLDRLFEVWEKINHLLDKADHAHLNRKQVILNVFLTLEDAVRS